MKNEEEEGIIYFRKINLCEEYELIIYSFGVDSL
jgi:hypothetical protein